MSRRHGWVRTDAHDSRLELGRRHLLENANTRVAKREEARELNSALLELKLRAGRVSREHLRNAVLLRDARRVAGSDLRDGGEHELADEVVGIWRIEDGEHEINDVLVCSLLT